MTVSGTEDDRSVTEPAVLTSVVDRTLVITLNRPRVKNAIDSAMSLGVLEALERLDGDEDLRVGVLTGNGGTFCAGMDLRAFARSGVPKGIDSLYRNGCRKPLVAAIEGVAYGGGLELALVADLLVASREARFASPEVKFGLFPAGGALVRLPRLLPGSLAAYLVLTGEPLSAERALEHGLIVRMSAPGAALSEALELAGLIAGNAPLGVEVVKQLLRMVPGRSEHELWAEQVELVQRVFGSEDASEGARAFAEKRDPVWKGR